MTCPSSAHARSSSAMVSLHADHAVVEAKDTRAHTTSATAMLLVLQTQQHIHQQQYQLTTEYHNKPLQTIRLQ